MKSVSLWKPQISRDCAFYRLAFQSRAIHDHRPKIPFPSLEPPLASLSPPVQHLTTLAEWSPSKIRQAVFRGLQLKRIHLANQHHVNPMDQTSLFLTGKTLALLFSKKSTRTRVSAESAWSLFGGHTMFLGASDIQLGTNETLRDTAQVLGSMVDMILARVGSHEEILELARYSRAPVVNALSDTFHPLQILADLMTLAEVYSPEASSPDSLFCTPKENGFNGKKLKVAWIGDANNILNSLAVTLPRLGIHLHAAVPNGYDMNKDVLEFVLDGNCLDSSSTTDHLGRFELKAKPEDVLEDANVIITDTWVSMGQESEKVKRLRDFAGYQVTEELAQRGGADPDWKFMHCLPRKAEEVNDQVFYGPRSLVFEEALNRKYSKMAVFEMLMKRI